MPSKRVGSASLGLLILLLAIMQSTSGQGMQNVLYSQARLFPSIGPGVAAIKRDAAGHYYVLAEPATEILVFDSTGRKIGQIPNVNSKSVAVHYAVGIDLDSQGRLYVADRGANAVDIFTPNGALVTSVPVTAVTSVVALPDGQFAVTKLQSRRLVQIMDQTGAVIRTFGDTGDQSSAPNGPTPSIDRGRIMGDSAGNIYFAFTSLPDPALQRFDRYGYSAYDSVIPAADFGSFSDRLSRVELGYTMSGATGPESITAWTDLHSVRGSVGRGGGRGRRGGGGAAGPNGATVQSSTGGGMGATDSDSSSGSASSSTSTGGLPSDIQGNILSYSDSGIADADTFDMSFLNDAGLTNLAPSAGGPMMPGMMGMGIGGGFHMGFHPGGVGSPGGFSGGFGAGGQGGFGGEGFHPDFGGGHFDGADGHFHPGYGTYRATATVKVDLDDPSKFKFEKPAITAVGIDPQTQDAWAAIADTLVHLDSNGNRLEIYYLTITGGQTLKPTAILVEPTRILIASDPWGIYEFPRPDRPSAAPAATDTLLPQQMSPVPAKKPAQTQQQ